MLAADSSPPSVFEANGFDGSEDVNGDGWVTAVDALVIINQLNRWRWGDQSPSHREMDVDGNGGVSSLDALRVINRMRREHNQGGQKSMRRDPIFRSIDGTGNHLEETTLGAAGTPFARIVDAVYADGMSEPAGGERPTARMISNLVCAQTESMPNSLGLSDMIWQWGQFIDHDIDLTREGHEEPFNVLVPEGDPMFDPLATGEAEIGLMRSAGAEGTGESEPRQQVNDITSFIDGSMVYGSTESRAEALRSFQGGQLKTSEGDLLPMNVAGLENAGGTSESLFIAGDIRANEQVGLTSMHTLWVREHNRIATEIAADKPFLSDEAVYQRTRRLVIAEIQAITFEEYLPALLGSDSIPDYVGYDPDVDPRISNLFATAAYRYGHTQLPTELKRMDDQGGEAPEGDLPLRDAFFNPMPVLTEGIDSIIHGLVANVAQEIDNHLVDDVRNFLFGPPGSGGFDLASLNIQRGRDHGLPDYKAVRSQLGLGVVTGFDQVTSDEALQNALSEAYGSVDHIDVWVGALAEDHAPGAAVGELLLHVIRDQFLALRDGDRFWYQKSLAGEELAAVSQTRLSDVIARNTGLGSVPDNVFFV
ncbi:MAG: peroxidase family protein [Rubripirellula sp.]